MAVAGSGSRWIDVTPRSPPPPRGRRSSSSGRARVRTNIGWLRDHSSRCSMKSSSALSAQWMSSKTITGHRLGDPLEEQPPRGEEVLLDRRAAPRARAAGPVAARPTGAPPGPGRRVDGLAQLDRADADPRPRGCRVRPRPSPRAPRSHALAVGEAAAPVPPNVVGQAVDVLQEFPGEARLADASGPITETRCAARRPPRRGTAP